MTGFAGGDTADGVPARPVAATTGFAADDGESAVIALIVETGSLDVPPVVP